MSENMNLKGIYADKPALFQVFLLLLFVLAGGFLSSALGVAIQLVSFGTTSNMMEHPNMLRLIQLLSSVGMFLLPALAIAWTCSSQPKAYLSTGKIPSIKLFFLVFVSMFALSPTICLTGVLNKEMELPTFLAPVENWMRAQEELAETMTNILLSGSGLSVLLLNLLVIAVTAAVTEEFIFRGALQRIIEKWSPNHHIIIWSTAFLFSAFHMQFYGFIPRLLLGAYFGYLLFWSKSIWLPVFAHFVNNATAIIGMSNSEWKDYELVSGDIQEAHLLPFVCLSLLTIISFFQLNKYIRKELTGKTSGDKL